MLRRSRAGVRVALLSTMRRSRNTLLLLLLLLSGPSWAQLQCKWVFHEPSKREAMVDLARKAGLTYLDGPQAGYTRQKTDQGYLYLDPQGNVITDPSILERIRLLRLPPGYSNVWISMDPASHLQATGVDSKGRKQYKYHDRWTQEVRNVSKFQRVLKFGMSLPGLREAEVRDLSASGLSTEKRLAEVVRLLEISVIRVGNEEYARENGSYGLTTMQARHVTVQGDQIHFNFIGKEGIQHDFVVTDPLAARVLSEILQGLGPDETVFGVTSDQVNDYIKAKSQGMFTAKDFRTWVATVTTAQSLHESGATSDLKQRAQFEKLAAQKASEKLRNTPDVCLESYIHPEVFKAYEDGRLEQVLQSPALPGYSTIESAVLRILQ